MNISVENDEFDVKIDNDDLWSLDFTLSKIIHPALIRFKEDETGSGSIDKKDVPYTFHVVQNQYSIFYHLYLL